jgi:hypothetical protein
VELKRIVLQKDEARARAWAAPACGASSAWPSATCSAHRFWLDVKSLNERALALYRSEGFVEEGRLRESVRCGRGRRRLRQPGGDEHARPRIPGAVAALGLDSTAWTPNC